MTYRWADDANWSSGPRSGTAAKLAMSEAEIKQGLVGGATLPADRVNWFLNTLQRGYDAMIFGAGSDGNVNITGTTTLTRNMYYDTLTVQSGGILQPDGFIVFAKTAIDIQSGGLVRRNGNAGAAGSGDTGGAGGAALSDRILGGSQAGSVGEESGGGPYPGPGAWADSYGGDGGDGGDGSVGFAASGGTVALPQVNSNDQAIETSLFPATSGHLIYGGSVVLIKGGAGGSGGGDGDGGESGAGGGGGGGGVLILAAPLITIAGTVQASGGDGGAGANSGSTGTAAGGGGGGGGVVWLVYRTKTETGSVSVAGGAAGASGTGAAGNEAPGSTGRIIETNP